MLTKISKHSIFVACASAAALAGCEDKADDHTCPTGETKTEYVTEYVTKDSAASTSVGDTLSGSANTSNNSSGGGSANSGDDDASTGALSLSFTPTQVGIRPPSDNQTGAANLNLLSRGFSLVPDSSPMAQFKPIAYTWDPSQVPMKSMNKVLAIVAETAYQAFINKGKYIAKVKVDDMFRRGESGGGQMYGGGDQDSQIRVKTTDVLVDSTRGSDGKVRVRLWFSRTLPNTDPAYWMFSKTSSGQSGMIAPVMNYEVSVEVLSTVQEVPPYGEFKMTYIMTPSYSDVEDSAKGIMRGYLDIIRDTDTNEIDITYNERTTTTQEWTFWNSNTNQNENATATTRVEQMALASLTLNSQNKVSSGIAVTESKWTQTSSAQNSNYSNQSGAYYVAFDYENGSSNSSSSNPGRALIDYDPVTTGWFTAANGFDPGQPRCEEIGNQGTMFANEGYVAFDTNGDPVDTQTSLRLSKVDGSEQDGCWVSQWGTSCWGGTVATGSRFFANKHDGSKMYFTATVLKGSLRNSTTWKDVTVSTENNLTLTCTSRCPKPGFTAAELNDQWSSSPSMFLSGSVNYTFDAATRELKYTADGVTSTISMPADGTGYVSFNLTSGADSYMYEMNSWGQNVMLVKDGETTAFQPPQPLKFVDESFNPTRHARPNSIYSPSMTQLSDASYSWGTERSLKLDGNWLNVDYFSAANKYTGLSMVREGDGKIKFNLGWGQSVGLNESIVISSFSSSPGGDFPFTQGTTYYAIPIAPSTVGGTEAFYLATQQNGSSPIMASGDPSGSTANISLPNRRPLYDQWGNFVYVPKLSLAVGVDLTLDGDPDGSGPRFSGEKIHVVPSSVREQAIVRTGGDADCATSLSNKITDAKDTMSPPGALPSFKFDARLAKTARPTGSFPVRAINGAPVKDN